MSVFTCACWCVRCVCIYVGQGFLTLLGRVLLGVLVPDDLFWNCKIEEPQRASEKLSEKKQKYTPQMSKDCLRRHTFFLFVAGSIPF